MKRRLGDVSILSTHSVCKMKVVSCVCSLLSAFVIVTACHCSGQTNRPSAKLLAQAHRDLRSPNGEVRLRLAEQLASDHGEATFAVLVKLLGDKSVDVSYAAAESIEARADKSFDEQFITGIRALARENQWPAYRAAKNYPTRRMLAFLQDRLTDEIQFQRRRHFFDSRNCFYLSNSLLRIAETLKLKGFNMNPPEGSELGVYESFAKKFSRLTETNL